MADIEAMLKHKLLCSDILYKELFVPAEDLKGDGNMLFLFLDAACLPHPCPCQRGVRLTVTAGLACSTEL